MATGPLPQTRPLASRETEHCAQDKAQDKDEALLAAIDAFLEREVRPVARELDHADTWPAEIVQKMRAMGLFGCIVEERYGGLGLTAVTYARIIERISAVWMSLAGIVNSHLIMAAAVQRYGTETQQRKWLPRFATGELRGGIALTEPDCGTDLQAIRTTARRDGGHYVVNGAKMWITNSAEGNILAVLVKTDPKAQPAHKGMSLLLMEKGPGFKVVRKLDRAFRLDGSLERFTDAIRELGPVLGAEHPRAHDDENELPDHVDEHEDSDDEGSEDETESEGARA